MVINRICRGKSETFQFFVQLRCAAGATARMQRDTVCIYKIHTKHTAATYMAGCAVSIRAYHKMVLYIRHTQDHQVHVYTTRHSHCARAKHRVLYWYGTIYITVCRDVAPLS